jgi:hypothetical protein
MWHFRPPSDCRDSSLADIGWWRKAESAEEGRGSSLGHLYALACILRVWVLLPVCVPLLLRIDMRWSKRTRGSLKEKYSGLVFFLPKRSFSKSQRQAARVPPCRTWHAQEQTRVRVWSKCFISPSISFSFFRVKPLNGAHSCRPRSRHCARGNPRVMREQWAYICLSKAFRY